MIASLVALLPVSLPSVAIVVAAARLNVAVHAVLRGRVAAGRARPRG